MNKTTLVIIAFVCLALSGCHRQAENAVLLHRSFYNDTWERFDYVYDSIKVEKEKTYDLSMKISFTDAYVYDDFSMIFTIFDASSNPYRSRGYKF